MNNKDYTLDFNKSLECILKHYLAILDYLRSEAKDDNDRDVWYSEMLDVECLMEIFCR